VRGASEAASQALDFEAIHITNIRSFMDQRKAGSTWPENRASQVDRMTIHTPAITSRSPEVHHHVHLVSRLADESSVSPALRNTSPRQRAPVPPAAIASPMTAGDQLVEASSLETAGRLVRAPTLMTTFRHRRHRVLVVAWVSKGARAGQMSCTAHHRSAWCVVGRR
jgi:hypothetical protein